MFNIQIIKLVHLLIYIQESAKAAPKLYQRTANYKLIAHLKFIFFKDLRTLHAKNWLSKHKDHLFDATNFVGTFPSVLLKNVGSELFHKDKKICVQKIYLSLKSRTPNLKFY